MSEKLFLYDRDDDKISQLSEIAVDRLYSWTDAGLDDTFIVKAPTKESAIDAARRWVANRADEAETLVPDDLGLEAREITKAKGRKIAFMILTVL